MRGNYVKGAWDEVSDAALDTQGALLDGSGRLGGYWPVDAAMDREQAAAYALLQASGDPRAKAALERLLRAEEYEEANEERVRGGAAAVSRAEGHNRRVVGIAEEGRVRARDAQRPVGRRAA